MADYEIKYDSAIHLVLNTNEGMHIRVRALEYFETFSLDI